jgi:hypothetical protein
MIFPSVKASVCTIVGCPGSFFVIPERCNRGCDLFFGGQDAVQLLDKLQKFLPILFHRDLGAQVLNTIVVSLVSLSEAEVLQYSL